MVSFAWYVSWKRSVWGDDTKHSSRSQNRIRVCVSTIAEMLPVDLVFEIVANSGINSRVRTRFATLLNIVHLGAFEDMPLVEPIRVRVLPTAHVP